MKPLLKSQRGATLIVGLIMLMVTSVSLMSLYNYSKISFEIVQNLQSESIAVDLANATLEGAISTTRVVNAPSAVFLLGCDGFQNSQCFDIDADGRNDVVVQLNPQPFCVQAQIIQNRQLNFDSAEDEPCIVSATTDFGVIGAASDNSLCSSSLWEVTAVATDAVTQSNQSVTGDYAVRVATANVLTSCPAGGPRPW
ncbi:MAG: pilus assembly PilX family protein [Oceanococcus sp.]